MIRKHVTATRTTTIAALAAAALVASLAATVGASAKAPSSKPSPDAPGVMTSQHSLKGAAARDHATPRVLQKKPTAQEPGNSSALPAGVPATGNYGFLLKLSTGTTMAAYRGAQAKGGPAARTAAKAQLGAVRAAQDRVISALPSKSKVLYRTHAVLSGVAVVTNVQNYSKLKDLGGVTAVYPIAPKSTSNSYAVPLQGAPPAWAAHGDRGENSTVAIIDTGVDYTHANFGGVGTVDEYDASKAQLGEPVSPNEFPGPKVVGGYDLAGDDYNGDPTDPNFNPVPSPDPYPLDCNGHGSHVAGTVGGYGENANGSTYTGSYDEDTPFDTMRIGPGMAPVAKLYAFRVFGCAGSTDLVSAAIDRAADPNGDGDTSDHVDVINMSLGSDYGSPQDGDSVTTNAASVLGITMAIASGNGGDLYDVGGSPGDATRAIAVAASVDAYAQVDALNVSAPVGIAGPYASERSIAYDYVTKPDLSGTVVRVSDPDNLDGCDPLSTADAAAVAGHIAFVEWTDDDAVRRCGSAGRGLNLSNAGASGFIYADDEEHFAAGITGSDVIPGVLVAKSGGDAIRTQLLAHTTVTVSGTTANGFKQLDPTLDDTVATFSSRGIRDAGNAKPDVTAVGDSVFSTGNGTGNQGLNDSGTSMATPMVAGTAALVKDAHPEWNPEQVKADIMNTASQDLFLDPSHGGAKFAPNRVGSGRIDVTNALNNHVLAYVADDPGAVSASFGPVAVSAPTTLTKTIKVQNTSNSTATYAVSYESRTTVPGAEYTVSPDNVTLDPRSSKTVTVTLTIDPSQLTKTIDPTVDRLQGDLPRQYVADASGLVVLTGADAPTLRVPVYSAPRPASVMTQPASVTLPAGANQEALLALSGHRVNQGTGATTVQSIVAGFELQATSGALPSCSGSVTSNCVGFSDERAADLKYVGVTSDAQQVSSIGGDPNDDGLTYFAISTQGPWRTQAGLQEYDVLIDVDRDGTPDLVLFNTRLTGSDVMVDELIDLNSGDVLDLEPINDSFGDTDTALFDSDTLVMPVATGALGLDPDSPRIDYGVAAFSAYQSDPLDTVGVDSDGNMDDPLSFDPITPGVAVFGSFDGDASALLYRDSPGSVLKVTRNAAAYGLDHGQGVLMVHFQNTVGTKAQLLALKSTSSVSLTLSKSTAALHTAVKASISVANTAGIGATGTVDLRHVNGAHGVFVSGNLSNGKVTLTFTPKTKGTYQIRAEYHGNGNYLAGNSKTLTLVVN